MTVLENSSSALCREEIEERIPEKMDRVTVYRILQSFCDNGKAHKIVNEDGKVYYAPCRDCTPEEHHDNHPHFHCIACNTITCVEESVVQQPLPSGYSAISVVSYVSGYCSKCGNLAKTVVLFVSMLAGQFAFAQTEITVVNEDDHTPVAGATVYFPDMKTGGTTDSLGRFLVKLSASKILIQILAPGYLTYLDYVSLRDDRPTVHLQPSVHELREIVVSDNNSRLQGENVMNVEKLKIRNGTVRGISLADKLTSIAGVENSSTGIGIGKPVIRGLSGTRIAVFAQGLRLENQQWGDEHGLGLDENGYEQVEVIKGPASLLYGSDALGGVIYFVDERYAESGTAEAALNSEFNGNTLGFVNNGAFKLSKNRLHWNLFGGHATHADYRDGENNLVRNTRFNASNFKTSLGYTGNKFVASLKYGFLRERYGLTEPEEHEHESEEEHEHETEPYVNGRKPELPYQDLSTHMISTENTFFFGNDSKVKIDAGYVFNGRKEFEHHSHEHEHSDESETHESEHPALDMNLHTVSYNVKWYSPARRERWTLVAGTQGMIQSNVNRGEEILVPDASTLDFGVFAMSNFHFSPKAYLQFGVRFDTRRITGESFKKQYYSCNFSAGVYRPLTEELSFRANLSSGFRAPNMYELLGDGVHHGTNRYERGNRDLKTETGYQADLSLNYKVKHFEIFVNPYFNLIRDYIRLQPSSEVIDDKPVFDYTQGDAYLYGGEAGFHLHPHPLDWLHLEAAYGSTFGRDDGRRHLALMPSQKINATIGASFSFDDKKRHVTIPRTLSIYLQNRYSFAQGRVADNELPTPAYNLLNVGCVLEFGTKPRKIQLNVALNNILNETYRDHLSRYKTIGINNPGRNLSFKLSIPCTIVIR